MQPRPIYPFRFIRGMPQSVLSFVEVLLALGLASIATTGALALLAAVDYQMEKVRLENLLGGQIRYDQEWLAGMSYASLSACVPAGSDAASFAEAVFFSKRHRLSFLGSWT